MEDNDDFDIDDEMGGGFFDNFIKEQGKQNDKLYKKQGLFGKILMKGMKKVFGGLGKGMLDEAARKRKMRGGMMEMKGGGLGEDGEGEYKGGYASYTGGNIGMKTEIINMGRNRLQGYDTVNTYENTTQMRPKNTHIKF